MDIKKYIYGHCISPVRVRMFDAYTRGDVIRDVPCGKCLHCRNTHVNEWVTRLYAQSMYSQNVYFVTLDYAPFELTSSVAAKLAAETAAVYHNINITKKYGMQPLILCKNHLQDYFKRLRRNTSKTLHYFACGEYGTHAGGKGFGRPHFHIIIFTNHEFSQQEFEAAWTINGYKIGRVDVHDLRRNGSFDCQNSGEFSSKYVFRYVCKYLQKGDFDFEKLSTINYHRTYYNSIKEVCETRPDLFTIEYSKDPKMADYKWSDYIKDYSPFTCCSKRPSIGAGYLNDNLSRFSEGDFRLFGLPKECSPVFPRYFLKKTKEHLCPFMAFSKKSDAISSNSRIGYISSILRTIYDDRLNFQVFNEDDSFSWCKGSFLGRPCLYYGYSRRQGAFDGHVLYSDLHMYDYNNRVFYQFDGIGYNLWHKVNSIGYTRCGYMDIIDVLNKIDPLVTKIENVVLRPFHIQRVLQEKDLQSQLQVLYGGNHEAFVDEANRIYRDELARNYKTNLLSKNSKLTL